VLYLVLFGPLLERVAAAQGFPGEDAWLVFTPGLLIQLALFGSAFVGSASSPRSARAWSSACGSRR